MSVLFLDNIKINSPLPSDWKYRVEKRNELISVLAAPESFPYLGQLSIVVDDGVNSGLYVLIKEPNYSPPSSGLVLSDWSKLNVGTVMQTSADPDPLYGPQHSGELLYEIDTSTLKIWDGSAWAILISGVSGDNFVEYEKFVNLPVQGVQGVLYVVKKDASDIYINHLYRWEGTFDNGDGTFGKYMLLSGGGTGSGATTNPITSVLNVGGIETTQIVPVGTDLETFIGLLINPVIKPTKTAPSISITGISAGYREVGETLDVGLVDSFSRGVIGSHNTSPATTIPLVGTKVSEAWTGTGIGGSNGHIQTPIVLGVNNWSVEITYGAGTGDYYDSLGNTSDIFDADRVAGSISKNTVTLIGVYPMFYGADVADFSSGTGIYASTTKIIGAKANTVMPFHIPTSGPGKYIYIVYPKTYGLPNRIEDGNGFDVTASFGVTYAPLAGAPYSEQYAIYRTKSKTFVDTQDYVLVF